MSRRIETDICVIGAGSGGLSVAAGAVQMGARVVLLERGLMGGDCLNFGCVPSKSLIAAAHTAQTMRMAGRFGVAPVEPAVDMAGVRDHVRSVIAGIAPTDSVERFEGLGVTVLQQEGRFSDPRTVSAADGTEIRAKYFVVATGSSPLVPPIPGLDAVPFHTNETIFDIAEPVRRLVVIGGGPIGLELAQAHRRLGAEVTVVEALTALAKDDPEAAEIVKARIRAEGVNLLEGVKVVAVAAAASSVSVTVDRNGEQEAIEGSHLLVAVGRKPNIDGLNLEAAGVEHDRSGIAVNAGLRTTNRRIYAIGDVTGGLQFTHLANYHAGILIRRILFKMFWARVDYDAFPWVTFTDPELAQVGMTEARAESELGGGRYRVLRWSLEENDRARAERRTDGLIKAIVDAKGRVRGATIAAPSAGELILPWVMAVAGRQKIGAMAGIVAPYPTLGEISKRAAGSYYTPTLFSERTRRIVRFLLRF